MSMSVMMIVIQSYIIPTIFQKMKTEGPKRTRTSKLGTLKVLLIPNLP